MAVRSSGARQKGYIQNLSTGSIKKFMFNPTTFAESRSINYSTINGIGGAYPLIEFSSGGVNQIPVEIYLRGSYSEVRSWVSWLNQLCPAKTRRVKFSPPPKLIFSLGSYSATCVMTSIKTEYTMFDTSSRPIEAIVSINLTEVV